MSSANYDQGSESSSIADSDSLLTIADDEEQQRTGQHGDTGHDPRRGSITYCRHAPRFFSTDLVSSFKYKSTIGSTRDRWRGIAIIVLLIIFSFTAGLELTIGWPESFDVPFTTILLRLAVISSAIWLYAWSLAMLAEWAESYELLGVSFAWSHGRDILKSWHYGLDINRFFCDFWIYICVIFAIFATAVIGLVMLRNEEDTVEVVWLSLCVQVLMVIPCAILLRCPHQSNIIGSWKILALPSPERSV